MSGKRDLNPRPSPWQGDALPLSYSRELHVFNAAAFTDARWPRQAFSCEESPRFANMPKNARK